MLATSIQQHNKIIADSIKYLNLLRTNITASVAKDPKIIADINKLLMVSISMSCESQTLLACKVGSKIFDRLNTAFDAKYNNSFLDGLNKLYTVVDIHCAKVNERLRDHSNLPEIVSAYAEEYRKILENCAGLKLIAHQIRTANDAKEHKKEFSLKTNKSLLLQFTSRQYVLPACLLLLTASVGLNALATKKHMRW